MKRLVPCPLEARDIWQILIPGSGSKRGEEGGETVSKIVQVAAGGRMLDDILMRGITKKTVPDQSFDRRVNGAQRSGETPVRLSKTLLR